MHGGGWVSGQATPASWLQAAHTGAPKGRVSGCRKLLGPFSSHAHVFKTQVILQVSYPMPLKTASQICSILYTESFN